MALYSTLTVFSLLQQLKEFFTSSHSSFSLLFLLCLSPLLFVHALHKLATNAQAVLDRYTALSISTHDALDTFHRSLELAVKDGVISKLKD